jgi:hypothetical protein
MLGEDDAVTRHSLCRDTILQPANHQFVHDPIRPSRRVA